LLAILIIIASTVSLLSPREIYPTEDLLQSFFASDAVNLMVGLPVLLGSLWLAWRGKLIGLLLWPGALMFILYTYMAYIFSVPLSWYYVLLLSLVAISAYTLIGLAASIDTTAVGQRLYGAVPERLSGAVLLLFGAFVFLRVFVVINNAVANPLSISASELTILPADFLISPAWIIGGILLWQRKPLGYVAGLGLLFQASMLFIGLIAVLLLQPLFTQSAFDFIAVITVALMGLVCSIPFGLFLRGVEMAKTDESSSTHGSKES
jgi:hypothetical protein